MAWLRTENTRVIHSSGGLTYRFVGGDYREIPDALADEFISKGCTKKTKAEVVTQPNNNLDEVLNLVIESGDKANFKTDGTPNVNVVNSLLDKRLSAREITSRFWELMNNDSS